MSRGDLVAVHRTAPRLIRLEPSSPAQAVPLRAVS
jgi:hypothetical protein